MPTGSVLQVVQGTSTTNILNSTTTYADTSLSATITPSSTSNKILVIVTFPSVYKGGTGAGSSASLQIVRGSTSIQEFVSVSYNNASHQQMSHVSMSILDSPSTTSATTYKTQIKGNDTSGVYSNLSQKLATIILQEIAG